MQQNRIFFVNIFSAIRNLFYLLESHPAGPARRHKDLTTGIGLAGAEQILRWRVLPGLVVTSHESGISWAIIGEILVSRLVGVVC